MQRIITFKGKPLTLAGRSLQVGNLAPDFKVISPELKELSILDFNQKIKVISVFLSLDTPVCDLQVKEFNQKALGFSGEVVVIGISKDLPFAQKRFCQANEIKKELVLSDYKYSSFGLNYGLLIKELNLLARAVLIIDKNNILRYFKVVDEATNPPDYAQAAKQLEEIIKNPSIVSKLALAGHCRPCEAGTPSLAKPAVDKLMLELEAWQLIEDKKIAKEFKFKDFSEAKYFLDMVSIIAEEQGHHPVFSLNYNKLKIILTTHASGGLTDNDFIMAKIIDELGAG